MGDSRDPRTPPQEPSRREFFRKLMKGAKYAAPTVIVVPMAHLMQGQSSAPHGMGMGGGSTMGMM